MSLTLGALLESLTEEGMDLSDDSPDLNREVFASATNDPLIMVTEVTVDSDGDIVIGLAR